MYPPVDLPCRAFMGVAIALIGFVEIEDIIVANFCIFSGSFTFGTALGQMYTIFKKE